MHVAVILIERQRQRQFIDHSARRSLSVGAPVMDERLSENASLPGVRVRIAWFERDRALEQPQRLFIVRPEGTVMEQDWLSAPLPRKTRFGSPLVLSRVHWVEPQLVAEITYLTWTGDGLLRRTVYIGLRSDSRATQVRREVSRKA